MLPQTTLRPKLFLHAEIVCMHIQSFCCVFTSIPKVPTVLVFFRILTTCGQLF